MGHFKAMALEKIAPCPLSAPLHPLHYSNWFNCTIGASTLGLFYVLAIIMWLSQTPFTLVRIHIGTDPFQVHDDFNHSRLHWIGSRSVPVYIGNCSGTFPINSLVSQERSKWLFPTRWGLIYYSHCLSAVVKILFCKLLEKDF